MSGIAAVDVIRAKRDGHTLSDEQIDWVVDAYTKGVVADEQMSALAMAILLRGMTPAEIARWTAAMIASGERLDLSGGETIWTGYWERSSGAPGTGEDKGILEEGPNFPTASAAVAWGLVRSPRVVVVDAEGGLSWAGEGELPDGIPQRWTENPT